MKKLLLAFLALLPISAYATPSVDPTTTDTIILEGIITGQTLAPLNQHLNDVLNSTKVPKTINLVISSPGGSVGAGFFFIDKLKAVQARGTTVRCFVAELAASMAFQTLLQCDERYALSTSFLLWHRARVTVGGFGGSVMTGPQLYAAGAQLKQLDEHIYNDVRNAMPDAPEHYISFHFENETLHTGWNLSKAVPEFITVSDNIPGLMEALANPKLVRSAKPTGFFDIFRPGEIIYISPRFLPVN